MTDSAALYTLGFMLIFVGVVIFLLAIVLIALKHGGKGKNAESAESPLELRGPRLSPGCHPPSSNALTD